MTKYAMKQWLLTEQTKKKKDSFSTKVTKKTKMITYCKQLTEPETKTKITHSRFKPSVEWGIDYDNWSLSFHYLTIKVNIFQIQNKTVTTSESHQQQIQHSSRFR